MQTTLKMAERMKTLKVTGFHESLGGSFGKKLLAKMDIKETTELEIDPAYVSQIILEFQDKTIQLGYQSLMGVMVDNRRLTELSPGESGTISALEVGRGELARLTAMELIEGTEVCVRKYVAGSGPLFVQVQGSHVAVVDVEGFIITGDELYNYELPGAFVFVEVNGEEKQLSSMEIGETGRIIRIASGGNLAAELDKHWIKKGNEIRALHRKEPDAHPLMVSVDASRHHIPKGLTEKIFVEVM